MRSDEHFSPLRIVKKNITDFDRSAYRVYKSAKEYVTVEAATALEAFRESGIEKPLRILRETRFMDRLVAENRFSELEEIIETGAVVMAPPAAVAGHKEAVPPAQSAVSSAMDTIPEPQESVEAEWQPTPPKAKEPAAAAAPSPAVPEPEPEPAPAPAAQNELSEDDIQKLLGEEQAGEVSKDTDELSEEEIAKLLDGE